MSKLPETHYRSQSSQKPVWEMLEIPQSELHTIDYFCSKCHYHTAWVRHESWTICAWCCDPVSVNADVRKAESVRYKMISNIKKAIADAELQSINLNNKIQVTVDKCSDRDGCIYQNWQFLPSADHARMFEGIKQLLSPKLAAIAQINSVTEDYYAAIDF